MNRPFYFCVGLVVVGYLLLLCAAVHVAGKKEYKELPPEFILLYALQGT